MIYNRGSLDYTLAPPDDLLQKAKVWEWNPLSGYGTIKWNSQDRASFQVNSDSYLNPYSLYLDVTVDCSALESPNLADDANYTNKLLQLDSGGQSLIKELVITNNGVELERINDYDVLASWLKDANFDTDDRYQRDYEGLGGCYGSSFTAGVTASAPAVPIAEDNKRYGVRFWRPSRDLTTFTNKGTVTNADLNYSNGPQLDDNGLPASYIEDGTYYTRNHVLNMSQNAFQPMYGRTFTTLSRGANPDEFLNNYNITAEEAKSAEITADFRDSLDPLKVGPVLHYSPAFALNGFEPCFSQTVKQRVIQSGRVGVSPLTQMNFQIPVLSGHFGHLVAPNNFKLIPLTFFRDLTFNFTFNPHAMFSSWWSPSMNSRSYGISNVKLRCELVEVNDPRILQAHQQQYANGGIKLPSQTYYAGPNYPIGNGIVPSTVQFNLGFESLRTILFGFQPDDYKSNSCFRKNYRLSMNLTSMQLKIGTEYFPPVPIRGNAGNNLTLPNNNEFIKYLWKAFGKLQAPGNSVINPHNFAVSCRAVQPKLIDNDIVLCNDAQLCYYEENRVIGKALYALSVDSLSYDNQFLSGVNTSEKKPFELNLTNDASQDYSFINPVTMYTFFYHDVILNIAPDGIRVLGRN